jgi:hypothetical protein
MADVFSNACLVIAATYGRDPEAGCFFEQLSQKFVTLPYLGTEDYDSNQGSFDIFPGPRRCLGEDDPLQSRAWITQEWLLARRLVHFQKYGKAWICNTERTFDNGGGCHQSTQIDAYDGNWPDLVFAYSRRELTKPTDRLIALQGLVNELKVREVFDNYTYGMWQNALPVQLLWVSEIPGAPIGGFSTPIPSWSWAYLKGPISMPPKYPGLTWNASCSSIDVNHTELHLECKTKSLPHVSYVFSGWKPGEKQFKDITEEDIHSITEDSPTHDSNDSDPGNQNFTEKVELSLPNTTLCEPDSPKPTHFSSLPKLLKSCSWLQYLCLRPLYVITNDGHNSDGWVTFDNNELPNVPITCLYLCDLAYKEGKPSHGILMVQDSADHPGFTTRIGMGMIHNRAWFDTAEVRKVVVI